MNLRVKAIQDMKRLNLRDWSGLVELTPAISGVVQNVDAETGEPLKAVQILNDYRSMNPETGEEIIITEPVVTMALSSLNPVPKAGEKWHIRVQLDPTSTELTDCVLSSTRAPEGGASLGFIRFYPQKVRQS